MEKKENQVNENENVNNQEVNEGDVLTEEEIEELYPELVYEAKREQFVSDKKKYHSYYFSTAKGKREFKVNLLGRDVATYEQIKREFEDNETKCEIVVTKTAVRNNAGKKIGERASVTFRSTDTDGTIFEMPMKPKGPTDNALLLFLLGIKN